MKTDAELVADVMAGGPEAFGPIVERYGDAVFGVALARLRNFHEAEDAAQQALVEAFERLESLKDPARLGAWLRSITIHKCIDRLRRRRDSVDVDHVPEPESDDAAPHDEMERTELRDQVLAAIGRLTRTQRETATLFYINGYSVNEVAGMQEVPVGTVKRRLYDARERLKEEMIHVVEDVLKSEAPKDDLRGRVVGLLNCYTGRRHWTETLDELRKLGGDTIPGFVAAFKLPHWQSRRFAAQMLRHTGQESEAVIDLIKQMAADSNKKVRKHANALLHLKVDDERKRKEFVPLLVPLLQDRSGVVRWRMARELRRWAADVPLEVAAEALANEKNPKARGALAGLVRRIVEAGASADAAP